jgi:hypothetical protein
MEVEDGHLDLTGMRTVKGNVPGTYSSAGAETDRINANRYVQVCLTGWGGTLGQEDTSTIENVGRLYVSGDYNGNGFGEWTIMGDTSCIELVVARGKLIQNGCLTVLGNMLLLGCDIDWTDATFEGGLYAAEDTIFARPGSRALFRNGFHSDNGELTGSLAPLTTIHPRSEALLLGGDASFAAAADAEKVAFQIAGDHNDDASSPCAIRVCGNSEHLYTRPNLLLAPGEDFGYDNHIDLSRSLDIGYYDSDGNPWTGPTTAIRGNCYTRIDLRGGDSERPNSLRGALSNIGTVSVHGRWNLADGFRDCGRLTLAPTAHLDLGRSSLDVRCLTLSVDSARRDPYLTCAGLARTTVFEVLFDEFSLTNPLAQSYLVIDGLDDGTDVLSRLHRLNGGFDLEARDGGLYVTFEADGTVGVDSPRDIHYFGLMPLHCCPVAAGMPPAPETLMASEEMEPVRDILCAAVHAARLEARRPREVPEEEQDDGNCALPLPEPLPRPRRVVSRDLPPAPTSSTRGLLAQTVVKSLDLARGSFGNRLSDVKGNGNDPFIGLVGAHSERDLDGGSECRTTFYGITGGADYRWDLSGVENSLLRAGAFLGHVRGDVKYRGDGYQPGERVHQRTTLAGIFAAYESFDARALKTNLDATFSIGFTGNELSQSGHSYRFNGQNISLDLNGVRNLFSINGLQVGPWAGIGYHRVRQAAHGEWDGGQEISAAKTCANFFQSTLGLSAEREFNLRAGDPDFRLRTYARLGWCCQPRTSSAPTATAQSLARPYGDRHSAIASVGFRQKFDAHWDLTGSWNGDFSGHYRLNRMTLALGYTF